MSGHPCFASLARLPDRSTPCRPASAQASNRGVGPASDPFPLGLLPSDLGIGMAKPTIPQARVRAEVLWGATRPEWVTSGTSVNGRPKRARECLLKVMILLQKSFWGVERKFLAPLMRFARGDVRDHIDRSKSRSLISVLALTTDAAAERS